MDYLQVQNYLQQATLDRQQLARFHAQMQQTENLLAPYCLDQHAHIPRRERERFFRSCSQHWLNAMLDVELGL